MPTLPTGGGPTDEEHELVAEIDRLRREVDRLTSELRAKRLDRIVDLDIETVLSSLTNPPPALDPGGRLLPDGRFIPPAIADGGRAAPPEPGAPRVTAIPETAASVIPGSTSSCEFAADDESATAFDQFFNAPDPQLDKIRRFLLD
ncbi:MAG: hypothetical protein OEW83_01130 [Acidimicrobiia bacterium]|nr:hypothetical protein [Acidimicrobiia bacterium]